MKNKCLTIFTSLIFLVFLLIFTPKSYSQPANAIISLDEIQNTFNEVKQKPTNNETFDRRMKVIEAWAILSVRSGKVDELRRITPPEEMENIMSLKKNGKESEAFKKLDELYLKMEKIGLPKIPSSLGLVSGPIISLEEIQKTLSGVKQKPTNNETFDRRIEILEAWAILLAGSGKGEEVRQIVTPETLQNIIMIKKGGKESEAFNKLDELYLKMERIGLPRIPSSLAVASGRCFVAQAKSKQYTANISIDYSNGLGTFSPYIFGAIDAPYFDQLGFDLTKNAGFKLVLVGANIPLPSNPDDPSQYDFTLLDKKVEAIVNIGAEPIVIFAPSNKPEDLSKYATYTQNIAKHLTQGWGNGHKWNVKVFRFGNEPDNGEFWKGTQQDFFETYAVWAKALKTTNPKFILVAPSLMLVRTNFSSTVLRPWITKFLEYCYTNNVPVDYFSVHAYSPIPYYFFYENFKLLRSYLQKYQTLSPLYGTARLANDEWNIMVGDLWSGSYHKEFDTAWVAAHNINVLINMIEQGVQLSVPMTGTFNGGEGGCHDFLLVDCNGHGKPSYYAFKGFNWLYNSTRLYTSGTDHMNIAAISVKKTNEIILVISNYDLNNYFSKYGGSDIPACLDYITYISNFGTPKIYNQFNITVNNLPWDSSQKITYEHYLVDDQHKLEQIESKTVNGDKILSFTGDMTAPSVHVFKVYLK